MSPKKEATLVTDPALIGVLNDLLRREPLFHRPELGTTRVDFENVMAADFWEVSACGRPYSREYVLETLEERHKAPQADTQGVGLRLRNPY